ncbi:uncharacterized protein DUF4920 [Christiangramia gaetbulicola]|uniref:Uncharacterized protein DUF4920 n=1 Tax=Christiangramia gaetbulicola TaxID=703340 RepID=A0A2T6AK88_9FLAO|nr:DUF4920 domain-containing protein [Christiangramia gaetbulicola]PTX44136.1 uncharacterized protein DUF4920 [Christiangramia gaetbulicola]
MKRYFIIAVCALGFVACKQNENEKKPELALADFTQQDYKSFGQEITPANSLSAKEMTAKYVSLQAGDTIPAKFSATINSVCKMKGCWMTLDLPGTDEDPMVKFKDYGFFVPKDIEGKEVIVEGIAFIEETSVEDQKHFAEDAGKTKEEIEAISEPSRSPGFLAHGVLIKQ